MEFLKGHWQLVLLTGVIFGLWHTPVVLPLKILVVFLHEFSHALATVLTGGTVEELSLSPQQGGHVISRGGNRFVILSAGYLGSLLFGAAILMIALRSRADRTLMALFGVVMLLTTALYIRDAFPFVFCICTGLAMLACARFLSVNVNDMILRVIGLSCLFYVPYDIFDDTIARAGAPSDAQMLAQEFGGSTVLWGGLWLVIALGVIGFCLRHALGRASNITFKA